MTTHIQKDPHIKELSARLQNEVDTILNSVDEKGLYAEFEEHEVVELHEIDHKQFVTDTIDQRIMFKLDPHRRAPKKNVLHYLFKRFEF